MYKLLVLLGMCFATCIGLAQTPAASEAWFVEPELMIGKVVPNGSFYPKHNYQQSLFLNIGKHHDDEKNTFASFYNYPETGVALSATQYRRQHLYGHSYTVVPYMVLGVGRHRNHSLNFKVGLGASYFTQYYDAQQNKTNKAIGSGLNWAFQAFTYYHLVVQQKVMLKLGVGVLHSSNGHTQLPNFGLNSAVLSLAVQYNFQPISEKPDKRPKDSSLGSDKQYFMEYRAGYGFHEFGGTAGPVDGPKKAVYSLSVAAGMAPRQFIKYKVGLAYRFYQHFYDYAITEHNLDTDKSPMAMASNIYAFLGIEFMVGHVSLDIEGGVNLYKPFYQTYNDLYEQQKHVKLFLKKLFPTRFGLRYYLINPAKNPARNLFLAGHVNANFGGADFTDFDLGYTWRIK